MIAWPHPKEKKKADPKEHPKKQRTKETRPQRKRDRCITSLSGYHELSGAPIRAKRTAHFSGQTLNSLRPLGRV